MAKNAASRKPSCNCYHGSDFPGDTRHAPDCSFWDEDDHEPAVRKIQARVSKTIDDLARELYDLKATVLIVPVEDRWLITVKSSSAPDNSSTVCRPIAGPGLSLESAINAGISVWKRKNFERGA